MRTNSLLGNFEELEASFNPIKEIRRFIKDNYKTRGRLQISGEPNKNGKYEVSCISAFVKNLNITSLTNNIFEWVEVSKDFNCCWCKSLISLEGAPKKVGRNFSCSFCEALVNLKGSPEGVGGEFSCSWCDSLKTLEGAPEEVGGSFMCYDCKSLKTLESAPKEVGGNSVFTGSESIKITKNIPISIIKKVTRQL